MGMTLAINESATPDRVQTIQAGSDPLWESGNEIATPEQSKVALFTIIFAIRKKTFAI